MKKLMLLVYVALFCAMALTGCGKSHEKVVKEMYLAVGSGDNDEMRKFAEANFAPGLDEALKDNKGTKKVFKKISESEGFAKTEVLKTFKKDGSKFSVISARCDGTTLFFVVGGTDDKIVLITTDKDEAMMQQLLLRLKNRQLCQNMLPEALLSLLPSKYEMTVFGLYEGQYQVAIMSEKGESVRLRMSDAVLLSLMSDIPLYIEDGLMKRQSVPYDENATGIAIPINTMDMPRLKQAMQKAVDEENYERASKLRDEINSRHN